MSSLSVKGVSHAFETSGSPLKVLENISLHVESGETVSILGPSGCGKSTFLRCISGAIVPDAGTVSIDGLQPAEAVRKKYIGFAFQEPALLDWRNVEENVRLPEEIGIRTVPDDEMAERVQFVLALTNLGSYANFFPSQLSGGMKQRVSLARALSTDPKVFLLDEPFASLDLLTRTKLAIELRNLVDKTRIPSVLVTHSIEEAVIFAKKIYIMTQKPAHIREVIEVPLLEVNIGILDNDQYLEIVSRCRQLLLASWMQDENQ